MLFNKWIASLTAPLLCVITGCGGTGLPSTAKVDGVLKYKGQPLAFYQVDFAPEDKNQRPAAAITDEDGKFVLGTNQPGDGAVVGKHRVAVTYVGQQGTTQDVESPDYVAPKPPKVTIPAKYQDPTKSDLTYEVPSSGLSGIEIDLD